MSVADAKKANPNAGLSGRNIPQPAARPTVTVAGRTTAALAGKDNAGVNFQQIQSGTGTSFIRTDTGEKYNPDLSTSGGFGVSLFSKAVKSVVSNPGNVVKKAIQVNVAGAVGVVSGFATGGVPGAIVGGVTAGGNALQAVSKEGKTSNTRLLKESVGFGAASGAATGVFRALSVPTPGTGGFSLSKAVTQASNNKFGVVGNIFNGIGGMVAKGIPAAAALFAKGGATPGTTTTADENTQAQTDLGTKVRGAYKKISQSIPGSIVQPELQPLADKIRDTAVGAAKNRLPGFFGKTNDSGTATGQPVIVNAPAPGQVETAPMSPVVLLAGAALLAFVLVKKH